MTEGRNGVAIVTPHTLNDHLAADGDIDFNEQEAVDVVVDKRTSDPGSPVEGQTWIRTDLA